ncbi:MAG: hypothetical protein WC866_00630 [Patescibacteria group bacterium]|jgi:hypothetical protein
MDDSVRRAMKEKLLEDARAWNTDSSDRSFMDILRNAIDLDPSYVDKFDGSLGIDSDELREWCAGRSLPETFSRWVIIDDLKKLLEADLSQTTEA